MAVGAVRAARASLPPLHTQPSSLRSCTSLPFSGAVPFPSEAFASCRLEQRPAIAITVKWKRSQRRWEGIASPSRVLARPLSYLASRLRPWGWLWVPSRPMAGRQCHGLGFPTVHARRDTSDSGPISTAGGPAVRCGGAQATVEGGWHAQAGGTGRLPEQLDWSLIPSRPRRSNGHPKHVLYSSTSTAYTVLRPFTGLKLPGPDS